MVAALMPLLGDETGERRLLPGAIDYLARTRRINERSALLHEFAWRGRRIDLATLTTSGVASAFELKLSGVGRALEQAIYNAQAFDFSWVVIDRLPNDRSLALAREYGIGVLVVGGAIQAPLMPKRHCADLPTRQKLRRQLRAKGVV